MNIPGSRFLSSIRRRWRERDDTYRALNFMPIVVCGAILAATLLTWQGSVQSLNNDITTAANLRMAGLEQAAAQRLASYEQVLRGGVGLFQASDRVTHAEWDNYLDAFVLQNQRAGVEAIGYALVFDAARLPAVTANLRQDGISNFKITPAEPPRDKYAASVFIKQIGDKNPPVYGQDMYANGTLREAAHRSRDTNATAVSSKIDLPAVDNQPQTGFLMFSPHYVHGRPTASIDERRSALRGYVYAVFNTKTLFEEISDTNQDAALGFRITMNESANSAPLYESANFGALSEVADVRKVQRTLSLHGVTLGIDYALDPARLVSSAQSNRPLSVVIAGSVAAIFATTIIVLVLRGRARELAAQKEEAVELAKDELLSLASHQLRTPATGVKQYLGMVLQGFVGKVSPRQRDLLERAYASNDRQLSIINEILHLAKIESGRIVLARQDVDLNELVRDIVNEQQSDINDAQHRLVVKLTKKPLIVNVDIHSLRMVIENIVSNAIKYTLPGGKITIKVHRKGNNTYIDIKDTGIGVAAADFKKIFEQFSRLPNAVSQQVGGTGIGLYLARHLVELHGGSIEVVSAVGKGSTFSIVLPDGKEEV